MAAQAAVSATAQRLKHEQKQEFTSALTVLGKTLTDKGWQAYKRTIERLAFSYDWDPGLLDLDVEDHAWNEVTEDDEMEQDRKNIFMLLCSSTGEHSHLLDSCPIGNAQVAWKTLTDHFSGDSAADNSAANDEFHDSNQEREGVNVSIFCTMIQNRAIVLISKGGKAGNKEMVNVLMKGLLPEFEPLVTQLQIGKAN